MNRDSANEAIALIGFGSSRPYNKEAMLHCIDILKKEGVRNTYYSFIGRESPTVEEMMKKVFDDGIERLTVLPFLMATGEMSIKYIPTKMGINGCYGEQVIETQRKLHVNYLRPIGESPRVADMFDDMIKRSPAGKGKKGIMLITHGSKLGYRSDLAKLNKERMKKLGYKDVYSASVEFEEPTIDECALKMVQDGVRHIIAVPMLLASGIHMKEDIPTGLGLKEGMTKGTARIWDRDIRIDITKPIGKHPLMKDVLTDILENC